MRTLLLPIFAVVLIGGEIVAHTDDDDTVACSGEGDCVVVFETVDEALLEADYRPHHHGLITRSSRSTEFP